MQHWKNLTKSGEEVSVKNAKEKNIVMTQSFDP